MTVVILELAATVQARIRVRPNAAIGCPHHDEARAGNLVEVVVTGFRDLVGPAGVLPDLGPQIAFLGLVILTRRVALFAVVGGALVVRRLEPQHVGHRVRIGVEQFLVADTRRAGAAPLRCLRRVPHHKKLLSSCVGRPTELPAAVHLAAMLSGMHVSPTAEQFAALQELPPERANKPIVMLNLLRYLDEALPGYGCDGMTGEQAYREYGRRLNALSPDIFTADPFWMGEGGPTVIGPTDEVWHEMLLVRYTSVAAFIEMVTNPEYLKAAEARTAAIADSRLVLLSEAG